MWNPGRAVILSDYYKNRTIIKVIFPRSYKWELNTPIKRCQKVALAARHDGHGSFLNRRKNFYVIVINVVFIKPGCNTESIPPIQGHATHRKKDGNFRFSTTL